MATCAHITACPFFRENMQDKEALGEMLRSRYCHGDPDACARLLVMCVMGPKAVPSRLWPNDTASAEVILQL